METLLRDIRHGFRMLRQNGASFTITAVIALALGIGANAAIFSLVNTVLLKEPPFPNASRIVMPQTKTREAMFEEASPAKFEHWAHQTDVLEDVSAFGGGVLNWTNGELPVQLRSARVTSAFFGLFGVPFVLGRGFDAKQSRFI